MSNDTTEQTTNEIPYGYCHCGCGRKTRIAPCNDKGKGWTGGKPVRFVHGHHVRRNPVATEPKFCECGCGKITSIHKGTDYKRGIVKGQYARFYKGHRPTSTPTQLFFKNVTPGLPDECWEWQGYINNSGYGELRCGTGPLLRAHRVSYEIHKDVIPPHMHVCHSCDNRRCVNPAHLWLGTDADNVHDMDNKGRRVVVPHYGEDHGMAKLTKEQVLQIRQFAQSGMSYEEIGRRFAISDVHAGRVAKGECWAHIE